MQIKSEEELWEILGSLDKFNSFLLSITEDIKRDVMLSVPGLVVHHIELENKYKKIKENFFLKNPELIKYKDVVGIQLNKIAVEQPELKIEDIFTQAGIASKVIIKNLLEDKDEKKL